MEAAAMSAWTEILVHWMRRRARLPLFTALAIAMSSIAAWYSPPSLSLPLVLAVAWTSSWLLVLRLAHDLGDLEYDRLQHPDRPLLRVPRRPLFCFLLLSATALGVSLLLAPEPMTRACLFFALGLPLLLFELWPAPFGAAQRLRRFHILALKYPLILGILFAPGIPSRPVLGVALLAATYLAATCHEIAHDRQHAHRRQLLAAEATALLVMASSIVVHVSLGAIR